MIDTRVPFDSARESGKAEHLANLPTARQFHPGRWIAAVVVALLVGWLGWKFATNKTFDWAVVGHYLFRPEILSGVRNTVTVTVLSMIIGIVGGLILALCRLSANPVLRIVSATYIWGFRGVPVLVQLIIWFNLGLVFHQLTIEIPFTSITLASWETNSVITPFAAVLLGLGLNEAAYDAEIIRGGLLAVPPGQREAAMSLGMTPLQILRKVTMPQTARVITPTISNQLIIMLKISALAIVVTYRELTTTVQNIYSVNLRTVELLTVASIWYIVLTTICTFGQSALERRLGRSAHSAPMPRRMVRNLVGFRRAR